MRLSEFLLRLALEPELAERFQKDPEGLSREFELDAEQLEFLRTADLRELRIRVEAEVDVLGERVSMWWIYTSPITIHITRPPDES